MQVKSFFLSLLFLLMLTSAIAQTSANGCLIPSQNKVYTAQEDPLINAVLKLLLGGNPSYSYGSATSLSPDYCSWTPSKSGPYTCGVCTSLDYNILGLLTGCKPGALLEGYVGSYTMVLCNLDDYTWSLGLGAGVFGFILIRRKNKC